MGIAGMTGLGNPNAPLLDNKGELSIIQEQCASDAVISYFSAFGGCDFQLESERINLGIEPTYMGDELIIISLARSKGDSYIQTGYAFGVYGTQLCSKTKVYSDYKYNSKFKRFVDKWHPKLYGE